MYVTNNNNNNNNSNNNNSNINYNNITYFDSFGVEHIPKEIQTIIGNKNIITNICRIQAYNSTMLILLYWIYWTY